VPVDEPEPEPADEPAPLAELEDSGAVVVLKVEPFA
jgi:hypothetical protein